VPRSKAAQIFIADVTFRELIEEAGPMRDDSAKAAIDEKFFFFAKRRLEWHPILVGCIEN